MKCASKTVQLSFICERARAKLPQTIDKGARVSRQLSYFDSKAIFVHLLEETVMSAIIQASPLEKLSQEPPPTGDSCVLIIFGASGDLTNRKLNPGLYNLPWEACMN